MNEDGGSSFLVSPMAVGGFALLALLTISLWPGPAQTWLGPLKDWLPNEFQVLRRGIVRVNWLEPPGALSDKPERACEGCWCEGVQAAS
jgi:hypothetical protein